MAILVGRMAKTLKWECDESRLECDKRGYRRDKTSGLLAKFSDQFVEVLSINAADRQARSAFQNHNRIAVEERLPFLHAFEVHQSGPAHAHKFLRAQTRGDTVHRF